jgi:meiotically up-regulated gene 157 (Mug157) protein
VDTGNWEPDSLAYFLHFLADYAFTPDLTSSEMVLKEPVIFRAVLLVLRTLQTEQRHMELSQYRYAELPNDGLGAPVGYTGMVWGGYRPSDDAQTYGYNIPVNMYVHSGVEKLLKLNAVLYKSEAVKRDATVLMQEIRDGIRRHGIVKGIYAYEVDGLGNALTDFDDANIPSLLSAPLLNFSDLQAVVYAATRKRVLSSHNPQFFAGPTFEGVGSPHTPQRHAWPLAVMARALTAADASEAAQSIKFLLRMRCGDGLMHESVHVDQPERCTRPSFEWANTLYVQLVWTIFSEDLCSLANLNAAHIRHE